MAKHTGPRKQQLFSLHGIRDSAAWQADISRVFKAEFEHVPLRYREYHLAGATKMFLWPWSLVSAILAIVVVTDFHAVDIVGLTALAACLLFFFYEWSWSGWSRWHVAPCVILGLGVWIHWNGGAHAIAGLWLLLACIVFLQELRELQCDEGPRFGWWPVFAGGFIACGLLPIYFDPWYSITGYVIACLAVAYWEAGRRRNHALQKVVASYQAKLRQGSRAQWVAHSFGTYLTCRLLCERATFVRLDHLVLFGAIAPENFAWQAPLFGAPHHPQLVKQVRNEFGYLDWAVPLATQIPWWGRRNGYGRSGTCGFQSTLSHYIFGAFSGCNICPGGATALLHNVSIEDYDHGSFLKPIHFRQLWLPHFWNYVPAEYENLLQLCNTVTQFADDDTYFELALEELLDSAWVWSPSLFVTSTRDWLAGLIDFRTGNSPSPQQVREAAAALCFMIIQALDEIDEDNADEKVLRCLRPTRAASTAIDKLMVDGRL